MTRILACQLMLLVSCLFWLDAGAAPEPVPPVVAAPAREAAALAQAERTGLEIYRHDRAAAVATDAALALPGFAEKDGLRGWVTEGRGSDGTIAVTFIDQQPKAIYRAIVSAGGELQGRVEVFEPSRPLSAFEAGAVRAVKAARGLAYQPCAERYNTVVLPLAGAGGGTPDWVVYLLPATTRHDLIPIGGTYRVQTRGAEIVAHRGFTRTCIALQTSSDMTDSKTVASFITHVMDPIPTEAHVFWSLWSGKSMVVGTATNGGIWSIEKGRIRPVERGPEP